MDIVAFAEGKTEEKVLAKLGTITDCRIFFPAPEKGGSSGKDQLNKRITGMIMPNLEVNLPVRCLVLRDLDTHEGETIERIVQSVSDALRRAFPDRGLDASLVRLDRHPDYDHVFSLRIKKPDLCLALHIADFRWHKDFIKSTIDDYVLSLALNETTAGRMAQAFDIEGKRLIRKISEEIPELMATNGIPLVEAKDYVRLYAAVIKSHTSPPVFAEKTMAKAEERDIHRVFAPLLAALDLIRGVDDAT